MKIKQQPSKKSLEGERGEQSNAWPVNEKYSKSLVLFLSLLINHLSLFFFFYSIISFFFISISFSFLCEWKKGGGGGGDHPGVHLCRALVILTKGAHSVCLQQERKSKDSLRLITIGWC